VFQWVMVAHLPCRRISLRTMLQPVHASPTEVEEARSQSVVTIALDLLTLKRPANKKRAPGDVGSLPIFNLREYNFPGGR
jgi:hypothetical protein